MLGLPDDVRGCLFGLDGRDDDPPDALTIRGLGNRKNDLFRQRARQDGVEAYPSSIRYLEAVRDAGLHHAGAAIVVADLAELMEHR